MPKVDLEKFLKDPAHQDDREFLRGVFNAFREEERAAEAEKNKNKKERGFLEKLFDGGE